MIVSFSARARRDLIAIGEWIARDDEIAADAFVEQLVFASERIADYPMLYPLAHGSQTMRRKLFQRYLIFYRIRRNEVFVVSVRHGARTDLAIR